MRCENIRVRMEIPVKVNSEGTNPCFATACFKDGNGVVYELQAIKDACTEADAKNIPIIQYNDGGEPVIIGIVDAIRYNESGFIELDGVIKFGGTSEEIVFSSTKDVVEMTLESVGVSV